MLDVIVVGALGKAGLLHINSYKKINNKIRIFPVDINDENYKTISDVLKYNNLNISNIVVDICTCKESFISVIDEAYNLGIRKIIVEKPFIVDNLFFNKYKDIDIVMVQNYLFSKVTRDLIYYSKNEEIIEFYGNFSKNRIKDSINKRGINSQVTLNYDIEMPHLIYIAIQLFGYKNISNIETIIKDMIYNDYILPKHGYGLIKYNIFNTRVVCESNLMDSGITKKIELKTKNKTIVGNYAIYDENLHLLNKASLSIYNNDKLELYKVYDEDDNFYEFIKDTYIRFIENTVNDKDKEDILTFSKVMSLFINLIK